MNDAVVVDEGGRRDVRGRRRVSVQMRERLLDQFECSGMTQRAFARREGINYHTLVSWRHKRLNRGEAGDALVFHEAQLTADRGGGGESFRGEPGSPVEVVLPDGVLVRGGDARALAAVVRLLR